MADYQRNYKQSNLEQILANRKENYLINSPAIKAKKKAIYAAQASPIKRRKKDQYAVQAPTIKLKRKASYADAASPLKKRRKVEYSINSATVKGKKNQDISETFWHNQIKPLRLRLQIFKSKIYKINSFLEKKTLQEFHDWPRLKWINKLG